MMTDDEITFPSAGIGAISYWEPAHRVPSAWTEHAPFAFWIMGALRPRTVVELGTHNGFSFFVFAEAARRLGFPCRLFAIDSWEGDDHAGFYGEEVYQSVHAISREFYPSSTELVRAYFSDAVSRFADESIDLLHIDGRHSYEDVREDFEAYHSKLSSRAVVLFHDTHEFQPSFGVHRFWEELAPSAPSFEFHHGHGLGVLALGADVPATFIEFIDEATKHPEKHRSFYSARGSIVSEHAVADQDAANRDDEIANLKRELINYNEALESTQRELAAANGRLDGVLASRSWKITAPLRSVNTPGRHTP